MINQKLNIEKVDGKGNGISYTKDGALIEGVGVGGNVLIVQKDAEWMRDLFPYFSSSIVLVLAHILYMYTGNMMFPIWLMYLATPLNGLIGSEDNTNLSAKC